MSSEGLLAIEVNGEPRRIAAGATVADLLVDLGFGPGRPVAVERNREIVKKQDHGTTRLCDGDRLEVVTFFGGGLVGWRWGAGKTRLRV